MVASIPGSASNSSTSRLSYPGELTFLRVFIASTISSLVRGGGGGSVSMSRSSVASGMTADCQEMASSVLHGIVRSIFLPVLSPYSAVYHVFLDRPS